LVQDVLQEYAEYLPLTVRQIFYRLVGAHGYDKTEQAYGRLGEHLAKARRARIIPMDAIRDGGTTIIRPSNWNSADEFLRTVRQSASNLVLDRTAGQPTRLVIACEAAGMAPQLARVADPFGIVVMSSGGFESVTEKYNFANDLASDDRPTEVLHIGDHDPSGAHMFLSFLEDVEEFAFELGGDIEFTRLAVTPTQIVELGLPTAPPKATDNRAFTGQTCQAEAIAPDVLADIVRDAIEERLDREAYDAVLEQEARARRELAERLGAGA
jgi:hypothetical protein